MKKYVLNTIFEFIDELRTSNYCKSIQDVRFKKQVNNTWYITIDYLNVEGYNKTHSTTIKLCLHTRITSDTWTCEKCATITCVKCVGQHKCETIE